MLSQLQKVTAKHKLKLFSILYSYSHINLHTSRVLKLFYIFGTVLKEKMFILALSYKWAAQ